MMKPHRILLPLSWLYGMVMAIRNALFDLKLIRSERVSVPVISVGNLTTGGTGKTPIVELIASITNRLGVRTAIVSRGYGRTSTGLVVVSDGATLCADADESGDEPHQLAENLPGVVVIVDELRARGARRAIDEFQAGVVILDDGFQHRRLERSLDLVVLDATQDVFSMPMLPAGHRREPLASLARADALIITKCTDQAEAERFTRRVRADHSTAPVFTSTYEPEALIDCATRRKLDPAHYAGRPAALFCGIGNPEAFERSCREFGIKVAGFHVFADHHRYSQDDLAMLDEERKASGAEYFLTTEKDAHRIADRFASDACVAYLKMRAGIGQHEEFGALIGSIVRRDYR